ncbi:glycosyltransferase family 2 protein [Flagellimonas pacifica]|uniref:Glycosyltransferase involved in cell wall bisynthesis n=1 Tax=Flagellimonas pacifica TaxID=1247520 RepID=A0A285MSW5_9FLAO|nr:glycosyltransferase family 2 protein [Allomuricauda parva]SNZ00284.1 Glycosyltransferase involved in cell wall bisynthesis [Allomuricauda parva]
MAISGLVITFNEEKNIGACIDSLLRVCNEVVIVDSNSSDDTVAIAREKGAKVYLQDFLGDGPQRIHGLQFCSNDWILNLDADEILDEDSYEFMKSGDYHNDPYDAYLFRYYNYMGNKLINFSGWYPDYTCRFFNKKTAAPSTSIVHQRVKGGNMVRKNLHVHHYGWSSFYDIISKKNQYTDWQAQEMFEKGKRASWFDPLTHCFAAWFRCYFFKRGFLNGLDGCTFSLIQAFFSYMKYAKLRKLQKES